ncbi:hypothetical protein PR202_gb06967 [Eleusine coracana subsp. coracana]|uniref:Uncharacterized protein n=1 Tax=Eleusine coracana subsp. coracana TaxID=191504 RepID=A0AAV5EA66_ELECO|nr:hypothetical protein QOZ80_2BG0164230 [Eleusine coracana subsp. coracana]GJN19667.1 hypothetical protein PR202_gb06967 [Eleusine coracana subsp. coracana]
MLLLHCSPRLLLRCPSPSHPLAAAPFTLSSTRRLRRSTAIRAEPEPPPTSPAEAPDTAVGTSEVDGEGPVELSAPTLFSVDDNPTPLQTATSILLTGAVSIFLFRSLRRRARRAKELRVRSSGVQKKPNNLTEEALESLRLVSASPVETEKPPSPVQALLGGIAAGVIAVILYKFTTTIEASLNRQTISDSFSVRQITITIRTIITGVCYLATSVFGINAVGLILYSLQLTFASIMDDNPNSPSTGKTSEQSNTMAPSDSSTSNRESASSDLQGMSDQSKNSTE